MKCLTGKGVLAQRKRIKKIIIKDYLTESEV